MEFNATFLVSAISFLLFVYFMNKIFYAPLENIITERKKLVDDTLNEAKKSRETASELLTERENKLNKAYEDSRKIVNESIEKANSKAKDLTQEAKTNSVEEINSQKINLAEQTKSVKSQLNNTVNELAEQIATKILG